MSCIHKSWPAGLLIPLMLAVGGRADGPPEPSPDTIRVQLPSLLGELDSPDFAARQRAEGLVEDWLLRPELRVPLAECFQQWLLEPGLSFEVRWHLQRWSRRLPQAAPPRAGPIEPAEIDRLLSQLDDDEYAVRLAAGRRLRWLMDVPEMVCPILLRLRQELNDAELPADRQKRLVEAWDVVLGAWLKLDPGRWKLPPVSEDQIQYWVEELASEPSDVPVRPWSVHQRAERELLLVMASDEYAERVRVALESRMEQEQQPAARARLDAIHYWTRPALVAEYWRAHHHLGEQHLIVGEPSQAEEAVRPSHFDYIDDRVAHCVSGNSLSPGEYPSGAAFPHPTHNDAFFHLVNLPTPRRRLAYAQYVKTDERQRLSQISHRTAQRWHDEKHVLSDRETIMLAQLDATEISRFVGQYVNRVEDAPLLSAEGEEPPPSRHAMLCMFLVRHGTQEAIPGLLRAIDAHRFLRPTRPPYELPWCAALSIALRDPWEGVDSWLAALIERPDPLRVGDDDGPQLGATAAGVLILRHHRQPDVLGLQSTGAILGDESRLEGFRFPSRQAREDLLRWWRESAPSRTGT